MKRSIPERIAPMLATSGKGAFDSSEFAFEIKWDGTRAIALVDRTGLRLHNRRLVSILDRFPELSYLERLPEGTALDGEVVVLEHGKPSFDLNIKRQMTENRLKAERLAEKHPATFVAWDLLYERGECLMDRPLRERRQALEDFCRANESGFLLLTDHIVGSGQKYFDAVSQEGLEGLIAKRLDSTYKPGSRSRHWLKLKAWKTEPFTVLGYTENDESNAVSALLIGETGSSETWVYRGSVGSGLSDKDRGILLEALRTAAPLERPPPDGPKGAVWRNSGLRCRVMYLEKTHKGRLRSSIFKGWVR